MFKHILMATDGSERSERAIKLGVDLARTTGAKVTAVMATWPIPPIYVEGLGSTVHNEELEQNARDFRQALSRCCIGSCPLCRRGLRDRPRDRHAPPRGHHPDGRGQPLRSHRDGLAWPFRRTAVLLGSETQKVLAHTKLPVLVTR